MLPTSLRVANMMSPITWRPLLMLYKAPIAGRG
jgi:hypothetical protein